MWKKVNSISSQMLKGMNVENFITAWCIKSKKNKIRFLSLCVCVPMPCQVQLCMRLYDSREELLIVEIDPWKRKGMDICGKYGCEWEDQREESDKKGNEEK